MEFANRETGGSRARSSKGGGGGTHGGVEGSLRRLTRDIGSSIPQDAGVAVGDASDAQRRAAAPPTFEGLVDGNIENVWNHGTKLDSQGFKCRYCGFTNKGGGATRLRDHLGGIAGDVRSCSSVPKNVQHAMRESRNLTKKKKREREEHRLSLERDLMRGLYGDEEVIDIPSDEEERIQMAIRNSLREKNTARAVERRRGSGGGVRVSVGKQSVTAYFDKELAHRKVSLQPRIDTALLEGAREKIGQAWAKFFHANDIAGLKADCPYFRAAMKITQQLGPVAHIPTSHEIDGEYLEANYQEAEHSLQKFKEDWNIYGVTVMCDSWTGPTGMAIINFMVYCNARMFFHKSIDASDQIQNHDFIYGEIKLVVEEIGANSIVQIITDNGANYKKACKKIVDEYKHIFWQPCAAHTINLMLKDIAKFRKVGFVVSSAKQICRFFYNHNRLHAEMKRMIGGELIRPNATRFGIVFMFLQSFLVKKDKLRQWMFTEEWKDSDWKSDATYYYAEECLTSASWWYALKWVVDALEPLYLVLRYADSQSRCTLSNFKTRMMSAIYAMQVQLGEGSNQFHRFMSKVSKRVRDMETDTLMIAAAVLDPSTHYKFNFSNNPEYALALTDAIEKMAETPEIAVEAIMQIQAFRECLGRFSRQTARAGASNMSPAAWWFQFGGEVPALQKFALRIVSQCVSSSGCERNWSAFALVHTKIRNRLGYDKLHKLVYVHYNLKARIEESKCEKEEKEVDPFALMMDAAMFDEFNPIWDWLDKSMIGEDAPCPDEMHPMNSNGEFSGGGRTGKKNKRKRARVDEDEEVEFESEDDGVGNEFDDYSSNSDDDVHADSGDELNGEDDHSDELEERSANPMEEEIEALNEDDPKDHRSRRAKHARKMKGLKSLYQSK